jgi:hypothetical protein
MKVNSKAVNFIKLAIIILAFSFFLLWIKAATFTLFSVLRLEYFFKGVTFFLVPYVFMGLLIYPVLGFIFGKLVKTQTVIAALICTTPLLVMLLKTSDQPLIYPSYAFIGMLILVVSFVLSAALTSHSLGSRRSPDGMQ